MGVGHSMLTVGKSSVRLKSGCKDNPTVLQAASQTSLAPDTSVLALERASATSAVGQIGNISLASSIASPPLQSSVNDKLGPSYPDMARGVL